MIPVREFEKVVKPDRETVTPIWEHMKIYLIPERDTCKLFITFINDIASCSMAFSIPCSVTYRVDTPGMHCIMLALRRDSATVFYQNNPLHSTT